MEFTKSHGAGNDFVLIEDLSDRMRLSPDVVRALCDRHMGIGADGVIRIAPGSDESDFFMDYHNAGGEVAEMCGNGIRCLAKWVADRQLFNGETMRVLTRAGVKELTLQFASNGCVNRVRVDMGPPIFERSQIPVAGEGADAIHEPLEIDGYRFDAAVLSMGNPHCVLFVDDLAAVPFERLGPQIETYERFPAHVNAEFAQVLSDTEVRMRVWERGVGETMACGTGACAVAVGANVRGLTGRTVAVHLPGGTLDIEWASDGRVYMTGPVEEVFHGTLDEQLEHRLLGWREPAKAT
jgi:diaminopimelate epimerase